MKISYLITCHNETSTLEQLLTRVEAYSCNPDEIVILDDNSDNPKTIKILDWYRSDKEPRSTVYQHGLDRNYGAHKNYGNSLCKGDWIFQLDGDECPSIDLVVNLKEIIAANLDTELIFVSRINDFIGVTEEHAKQWGWRLTPSTTIIHEKIIDTNSNEYKFLKENGYILEESKKEQSMMVKIKYKAVLVNMPDYQGRIYKNVPERIKWDRRLHEKIEGHLKYATLPEDTDLALYHNKTIARQVETNIKYNQMFTQAENQGHNVK